MLLRQAVPTVVALALLAAGVFALAALALYPYIADAGIANLNLSIYTLLAPLSTVFLLGLLYAWLVKLGTRHAFSRSPKFKSFILFMAEPFGKIVTSVRTVSLADAANKFKILSRPGSMLGISLLASALLAFVPYRPDLNPTGTLVGIDSPLYVTWVSQMLQRPMVQALLYSFVEGYDGSRPLLLVLLYIVALPGVSPDMIIKYLPMFLAPLLSLSSYIFVKFGQGSARLAGLTALFTPFLFYVTVGIWGGYYANMLAMIEVYLFLTCLLLFSKSRSTPMYGVMFSLSVALFLTHPWTWVLIATACLMFGVSLWKDTGRSIHLKSMVGIVVAGVILDVLKNTIFATRTVAVSLATQLPTGGMVAPFWTSLVEGLLYTHGGLLGNWLILGLGLLSVIALRFRDRFERLLILWVGVASLPFPVLDSYHKARIVYDLPVPVLASISLLFFLPLVGTRIVRWPGLIIVLVLIVSASYAIQEMLLL